MVIYLVVQVAVVLGAGSRPELSPAGIGWTAATFVVTLALAAAKPRTETMPGNPALLVEGEVTAVYVPRWIGDPRTHTQRRPRLVVGGPARPQQ